MRRGKRDNLFLRNGNWCVDILIDGQRIRRSFGKEKGAAEAVLHELEKRRTLARLGSTDVMESIKPKTECITFSEMCEKFLELRQDRKQITIAAYTRTIEKKLLPVFGRMRLNQITPEAITRFRIKLLSKKAERKTRIETKQGVKKEFKPLKPSTVNTTMGVLRNILDVAVQTGDLDDNPFRKVKGSSGERRENKPLSLDQIHQIIQNSEEEFRPMITFMAYTGCRPSEMYALRWKQVEFEKEEIVIEAGRVYGVEGPPKTKAGNRRIMMLPPVKESLKALRERQSVVAMTDHVFLTHKGQPFNDNTPLYRAWTRALKATGLARRRPYELRHSFASNMLAAGMPIPFISRMIGHANPATTFAYYAGDVEALRPEYARRMADVVAQQEPPCGQRFKEN
jgi:integrase